MHWRPCATTWNRRGTPGCSRAAPADSWTNCKHSGERDELFPELPTWLRLAQALARKVRITRQEALVRIAALRLLGDAQAAEAWVVTPREELGNRTPLRMARKEDGVTKVARLVAKLEREIR